MEIYERIFISLENSGKTQKQLAEFVGIALRTVENWKSRGSDPSAKYLAKIAEFFKISAEYLLTGEEKSSAIKLQVLSENQRDLLKVFEQLTERNQIKAIGRVEEVLSTQQHAEQTKENVG